ncbi:MAG TPA: TonB family protein [Candidatus Acidoferrales bacterium]|jgi:TonB family protein|nr:TonB family protein [Candidatus Acidoferrales bacterium]
MTRTDCARAETLAGAIALEEATDGERDAYRRHLSSCAHCVETLGGERDIERVMSVVARARDQESWEPDLRNALRDRSRGRRGAWTFGFGLAALAVAASLSVHLIAAGTMRPIALAPQSTVAAVDSAFHVNLERRSQPPAQVVASHPAAHPAAIAAQPIHVTHNVVAVAVPAANPKPAKAQTVRDAQSSAASTDPALVAALPPSERVQGSISSMQTQSAAPVYSHQAESIAVNPARSIVVRDVAPVGGTLTLPNPPSIAGREMAAEGLSRATATYALAVDERGTPIACQIQTSSGITAIDESVCRAAMRAKFTPRTVNGKPTTSIYRDAFVFVAGASSEP